MASPPPPTGDTRPDTHISRVRSSCDACAFRRVKCDGGRPCRDCSRRFIECTRLRQRRKRGPKGPRPSTVERIAHHKEQLVAAAAAAASSPPSQASSGGSSDASAGPPRAQWSYENAATAYHALLDIFSARLYTVWPIVDVATLTRRLAADAQDWQSHALAASLCSAVIAQLRLNQSPEPGVDFQAHEFANEAQSLRKRYDYRECCTIDSLLTSFFLHIYFSNVQKLSTASYLLRETVTTAHILRLHEPETYGELSYHDYQRRLRIFWILFVSERTFCAQNDLVPILHPISEFPEYDSSDPSMAGFADLARLFICLDTAFFRSEPPSRLTGGSQDDKVKVLCIQKQLEQDTGSSTVTETQHVDLNMTRHWIRTIIWRYSFTHFAQSGNANIPAFSATYPAQIAKESLTLLCNASDGAIRAHGYGMELKILRLASSMLDVLACLPVLKQSIAVLGWRDSLSVLGKILQQVGGKDSPFATLLQRRIVESDLPITMTRELPPPSVSLVERELTYPAGKLITMPEIQEIETIYDEEAGLELI